MTDSAKPLITQYIFKNIVEKLCSIVFIRQSPRIEEIEQTRVCFLECTMQSKNSRHVVGVSKAQELDLQAINIIHRLQLILILLYATYVEYLFAFRDEYVPSCDLGHFTAVTSRTAEMELPATDEPRIFSCLD